MADVFLSPARVGLAYNAYIDSLSQAQLDTFDYIEVPFELLNFNQRVLQQLPPKPLVLHCASLSLAGYLPPASNVIDRIGHFVEHTRTPWLGEHLAFIMAEKLDDNHYEEYAPDEPYNIGYTVNPVMNKEAVDNLLHNIAVYEERIGTEIIVENSPLYFTTPGSTMSQVEFINEICSRSSTNLLLDLTHLYISSRNFSFDVKNALLSLPLDRVIEVHVSGINEDESMLWDNHASQAPDIIFELLDILLQKHTPRAITMEYNWASNFPWDALLQELRKVRSVVNKHSKCYDVQ